jgi:hypothetical protein
MTEDGWRKIEELYHPARLLNDSARGRLLFRRMEVALAPGRTSRVPDVPLYAP